MVTNKSDNLEEMDNSLKNKTYQNWHKMKQNNNWKYNKIKFT